MKEGKSLFKNTLIIGLGKISTQIITFLLLPLFTGILTTSQYGEYDYIITIAAFIFPLVTLLLEESMFRFLIDANDEATKKTIISVTIKYILISTLISLILGITVLSLVGYANTWTILFFFFSNILVLLLSSLLRGINKIKEYSYFNISIGLITVVLTILFLAIVNLGVNGLLLSSAIANFITSIIIIVKLKLFKYVNLKAKETKLLKEMIKFSYPLIPNSIAFSVLAISDKILITNFLGTAENGIYSIATKFPIIISSLYGYFYIAWKETSSKIINSPNRDEEYNKIYKFINEAMISLVILLIAVMPIAFPILINSSYDAAYFHIPILFVAVYFSNMAMLIGGIFIAFKETKEIGTTTIVSALINLIINICLLSTIGIYAATISTLIANILIYIYRMYKIKKYVVLKHQFPIKLMALLLSSIIVYYINNIILSILTSIILMIILIMMNKNIIQTALNKFKNKTV